MNLIYFMFPMATIACMGLELLFKKLINKSQIIPIILLNFIGTAILVMAFNDFFQIIKGFLYLQVLIFTSLYDIETKTIPDKVHGLLVILWLVNPINLQSMAAFFLVPLPFLLIALFGGKMGGGDIKYMAFNGAILGIYGGITASFIGVVTSLSIESVRLLLRKREKNSPFALGPYLSLGCFITYVFSNITFIN